MRQLWWIVLLLFVGPAVAQETASVEEAMERGDTAAAEDRKPA